MLLSYKHYFEYSILDCPTSMLWIVKFCLERKLSKAWRCLEKIILGFGVLVIAVRVPRPLGSKAIRRHLYCRYEVYDKYVHWLFRWRRIYKVFIIQNLTKQVIATTYKVQGLLCSLSCQSRSFICVTDGLNYFLICMRCLNCTLRCLGGICQDAKTSRSQEYIWNIILSFIIWMEQMISMVW